MVKRSVGVRRSRGRPKKNQTIPVKLGTKILTCSTCNEVDVKVDADTSTVTCATCTQKLAGAPAAPKAPLSVEERELRAARKAEKIAKKAAKQAGIEYKLSKDLGLTRGWWFKKLFKTSIDKHGKPCETQYFSLGKSITKEEYERLEKELATAKSAKKSAERHWGKGWHLKKHFVAPDGSVWSKGKMVTPAPEGK